MDVFFKCWSISGMWKCLRNTIQYNRNLFILSKFGIPVGIVNEEIVDFSMKEFQRRSEVLYVTTASSYHSATLNNTLQFLHNNFQKRGNSDKDVWLIGLDISVVTDVDERYAKYCSYLSKNIEDYSNSYLCLLRLLQPFLAMKLDIDDDVYIYQVDVQRSVEIYQLYEVYKIHKRGDPVLNEIGNSTAADCCNFVNDGKHARRHDLRVCGRNA